MLENSSYGISGTSTVKVHNYQASLLIPNQSACIETDLHQLRQPTTEVISIQKRPARMDSVQGPMTKTDRLKIGSGRFAQLEQPNRPLSGTGHLPKAKKQCVSGNIVQMRHDCRLVAATGTVIFAATKLFLRPQIIK